MARAVAAGAAGLLALSAAVLPSPAAAQEEGDGLLPPGAWTEMQRAELLDLIARTEAALPGFSDVDELIEMGFYDFGVTAPGGWVHFINWEWIDDEHILDPEHPESLVFHSSWNSETGQSELELVSAMFFLPSQHDLTNMPADVAWMPGWHTHEDICISPQHTFAGIAFNGTCSSGVPFDKPPMMHVWIVDNECGHRFGGIDIGGLHCDVHGPDHPDDPDDPMDPHDPDDPMDPDDPHDPGDPMDPDDPHDPGDPMDPHDDMGDGDAPPPAQPTHRQPDFAG